ncbi:MAG: hypothetical protein J5777_08430 [Clostridiales bacterium]|nr:hypothetical protein [Clostridiales bacterium]
MWSRTPDSTKWAVAVILAGIGAFFLFMTYGAMISSKRHNTHVSGVPFVGGFFVFLGFILSPVKWLALLALLDPGPWMIPFAIWEGHKAGKDRKDE